MPRCADQRLPDGAPSGSASGSQRYLPRRWARDERPPGQGLHEVLGAREVPADRAGVVAPRPWRRSGRRPTAPGRAGRPRPRAAQALAATSTAWRRRRGRRQARLGGLLLGRLLGPAGAAPVHGAGEDDGGGERLRVVGAVVLDLVARGRRARARRRAPGGWSSSPGRRRGWRPRPASGRTAGARAPPAASRPQPRWIAPMQRLEGVGEDRVLVPAAGGLLAAAEQQVRADAAVAEPPRDPGERAHVDHRGAQLGQLPLGQVGLAAVERVGDDQAEHRVAQELQALVGGQAAVLVRVRAVGQREPEQVVGQLDAEGVAQPDDAAPAPGCSSPTAVLTAQRPAAAQTERTWRPSYWPQFGQAWCGGLSSPQARFGHGDSVGAVAFHSTGATGCWRATSSASERPRSVLLGVRVSRGGVWGQCRARKRISRRGPAQRGSSTSWEWSAGRSSSRSPQSTHSPAQSSRADRRQRQAQDDGVADQRLEVEEVALDPADLVLLAGRLGRAARVGEQLLDVERELSSIGSRQRAQEPDDRHVDRRR